MEMMVVLTMMLSNSKNYSCIYNEAKNYFNSTIINIIIKIITVMHTFNCIETNDNINTYKYIL